MACPLHTHLRSSIVKRSIKLRTFWILDDMDKDVNFNTSFTGRAIHTLMTHGLITRTYMRPTFSKNSTLPTLLWLDELKYKKVQCILSINPYPPLFTHRNNKPKDLSATFISISSVNMSHSSSPIYIPLHSASPELAYPNAGNTPFPPASPTPFAGNIPIPPMNMCISTPDSIPTYV